MKKITVIDYGAGNILSVKRGFEYFGDEVVVTDSARIVRNADILVLPGVGAFSDGMKGLRRNGLDEAIIDYSTKERPFMGICLGMQMMLEESEEFGVHEGLGLIPGKVVLIEGTTVEGVAHKIPHISWNELFIPEGKDKAWWENTVMDNIEQGEAAYFVHSYTARPLDSKYRLADSYYGGRLISAAIRNGYLYGCQFHPEKSGRIGLNIIKNFINL